MAYDEVFFPDLQQRLTEYFNTNDAPLFSFNVTYQATVPTTWRGPTGGTATAPGDYSQSTLNALNNYFYLVQDSSAYMKSFTQYLDSLDEPVVLLLYGDHKPGWATTG